MILQYSGKMLLEYKNETLSLNEGDIVLVDPVETISMYPQGLVSQISVHLSRENYLKKILVPNILKTDYAKYEWFYSRIF